MTHKVSYRVDVLRRGAKFSELRWLKDSAPDVLVDASGDIMGSLGGTFLHNPDIEYLSDELQPVLELDGQEYPLGVYRITTYSDTITAQGHFLRLDAYDRSWMIQTIKTEGILHLAAGTNYITAVQQLMTQAGIGLVIATPTSETLQTDREDWQEGTDYLTICNQLLGEINYKPVWFDGSGIGHLEPKATPNAAGATRARISGCWLPSRATCRRSRTSSTRRMSSWPFAAIRTWRLLWCPEPRITARRAPSPFLSAGSASRRL